VRASRLIASLVGLGLLLGACSASSPDTGATGEGNGVVRIAAASDLQFALEEIVALVAERYPDLEVTTTYGSSGTFLQQIVNGAPFDVFLSADLDYPRDLVDRGLADEQDVFPYAIGRLVEWVPDTDGPRPTGDLSTLTDPAIGTVAIANPEHAPYGVAAVQAMKHFDVYEDVQPKLVLGENVAQAAEFVLSGNADAGVVALSLVLAPGVADKGTWARVPLDSYARIDQGGVVLAGASDAEAARDVRDVILSAEGREILERYGFSLPKDG
jgi:molybdate transport system substrate-binding protein